jgi:hypothetical protein
MQTPNLSVRTRLQRRNEDDGIEELELFFYREGLH